MAPNGLGATTMNRVTTPRLPAVDALRGAVMIIMALDHTRDFVHSGAMSFQPDDLTRTTAVLFFTRWVTHVCAPVFVFVSGVGAFLRLQRDGSRARLSRFLWTRGLWLVLIELTVMRLALNFTFDARYPVLLLILWALGMSMVAMAALIHLPTSVLASLSLGVILLHNMLDGVRATGLGAFAPAWRILHEPGVFMLGGTAFVVGYPLLPWVAVMAVGFCFGRVMQWEPGRRHRALVTTGATLCVAFLVLRAVNVYGDPSPWSPQTTGVTTVLSFLRTTKYPPSLAFLLMTLGPALLALAWFETRRLTRNHPLVVIGRVPFFYYVVHFLAIHVVTALMAWLRYGEGSHAFLASPLPSMGGSPDRFPPDFGYPLWVVYVVWACVVAGMYPLCRWFAGVKSRSGGWWVSYV
jgi:uncharacterized membrane protein